MNAWKYLSQEGAKLVAVCDTNKKKAEAAGREFCVPFFCEMDKMLEDLRIDLLDVVTQMDSRPLIVKRSTELAIATILQKPLAPNLKKCVEIFQMGERNQAWLAVHENFRFGTGMQRVKKIIQSKEVGDMSWGRISFRTGYDVYRRQPYLAKEERAQSKQIKMYYTQLLHMCCLDEG